MGDKDQKSKKASQEDDALIRKIMEKILGSQTFMDRLVRGISERVAKAVKDELQLISNEVKELKQALQETSNSLDNLEQFSRRKNLRVFGIPGDVTHNEDTTAKIVALFNEKMDVQVRREDIETCYRVRGTRRENQSAPPVFVRLINHKLKKEIYAHKTKLKGSKVVLREDLTSRRLLLLDAAVKRYGRKNAWSINGTIYHKTGPDGGIIRSSYEDFQEN